MKRRFIFFFLGFISQLSGHNNFFLPGDAFFSTSFSGEEIEKVKEGQGEAGSIKLVYERLDNQFMACGNIGYHQLELRGVDASFRENLLTAYQWMREREEPMFFKNEGKEKEDFVEWNPVVALVYNKGKVALPLGAKFNEDWQAEGAGLHRGFLDDAWSVVQEWQRAESVAPLELDEKLDSLAHLKNGGDVHRTMDQVLTMKAADTELVFVGFLKKRSWVFGECPNLKKLALHCNWLKQTSGSAFYLRVTSEEVRLVTYGTETEMKESVMNGRGEWVEVKGAQGK